MVLPPPPKNQKGLTLEELKGLPPPPEGQVGLTLAEIQSPVKELTYGQRVAQQYSDIGNEIKESVLKNVENIKQGKPAGLLRTGLRTVGGVARAAFTPILEAPGVKQATEAIASGVSKIPGVQKVAQKGIELANKNPEIAKDIGNIVDILTLGGGSVVAKEGKAIASDVALRTSILLKPSEEAVQQKVISLFEKSIKPTSKKTLSAQERYNGDILNALKTVKTNVDQLNIEDDVGEIIVGRTPQTINELAQGIDQTKKIVFDQYDTLAKQAGTVGATIDTKPVISELKLVADNKALQLVNPSVIEYANQWQQRLQAFGSLDAETTQEVIKTMNANLQAFYRNPSYDTASKVAIDAGIVNNLRVALDKAIEGATGEKYQVLKNQYSALKAIENDVVRASMREAKKNTKGLLDYTDMFTGGQMISGILSLNPAMFTKGAIERSIKEYIKFLNDPNRAVSNMFDALDDLPVPTLPVKP